MHEDTTPESSLALFASRLSERQKAALPYLLKPGPVTERAREAGIHRDTIYRWMRDDAFRETLDSLKEQVFRLAESEIQSMAYEATSVIYEAMQDDNPRTRLRAAQTILKFAHEADYGRDLAKRVDNVMDAMALRPPDAPFA